jgi:hypothetical protein
MAEVFPRYYRPRPYQAEAHALFRTKRISGLVFPRQSGKDMCLSMENIQRRLMFPKTNGVYIAPDAPSVRNILYDKSYYESSIGQNVKMLHDNVPESQVSWKDTRMEGRFTNKSILKLEGWFQTGRQENGVGTAFDDYAFTELSLFTREDPIPRLMPIITTEESNKRLMFVATPRGKRQNPLWQIMESNKNNPEFGILIRDIDDLNELQRRYGLPPVRSQQQLEIDKQTYLERFGNTRMFEQEYYCSFEEMDAAAVYGEAYAKLLSDNRVTDFNLDPSHPVYVAFDIGSSGIHSDATSWIAFQWFNNKLFLYDCGEGHGLALPEYVDVLQQKHWFNKLAYIILPWDGDHHETAVNTTPADMMRQRFPNVAVLAKGTNIWTVKGIPNTESGDVITAVQQTRMQLYNTIVHKTNCDRVTACFENYKYKYNTAMQEWSAFPVHDQYSHMMDALRYVVQAVKELDFFGGQLYDSSRKADSDTYEDDWAGVWS